MPSKFKYKHKKPPGTGAVFADPTNHRRVLVRIFLYGFFALAVAWLIAFLASFYYIETAKTSLGDPTRFIAPHLRTTDNTHVAPAITPAIQQPAVLTNRAPIPPSVYAYVRSWPLMAIASVKENIDAIDVLMPEWYRVNWDTQKIEALDTPRQTLLSTYIETSASNKTVLPVVNGFDQSVSFPTPNALEELIETFEVMSSNPNFDGLCLDYRWVESSAISDLFNFLAQTSGMLSGKGKQSCVLLQLGQNYWPLAEIETLVDTIVFSSFQQPDRSSFPKPIAPYETFAKQATAALNEITPSKAVFALANVGFDWTTGEPMPASIPFSEVARLSGLHKTPISFDAVSRNPFLSYVEAQGRRHQIWFTDAIVAYNQLQFLAGTKIKGVAVLPVGGEDPGIWKLLNPLLFATPPSELLQNVSVENYVGYEGRGDFLTAFGEPKSGIRLIEMDPNTGLIANQTYTRLPETITIARWGAGERNNIALTFDDGPDEKLTPAILDILEGYDVPATFFVIGEHALKYPEIVRRILNEGHILGVHTFSHPNIQLTGDIRLMIEANSTQRLLASITGYNTILFRAPYAEDSEPQNRAEAEPLVQLSSAGYIMVGTPIDPRDWEGNGVDEITDTVLQDTLAGLGNIILLHDAGGNRSQTLTALPRIIETLRDEGFNFVSLDELMSDAPPDLMVLADDRLAIVDSVSFAIFKVSRRALLWMFAVAITLGVMRSVIVAVLAFLRRAPNLPEEITDPQVTVIVPAFCEETVILQTIRSVLASDYENLRVIVVDDGSTDDTYNVVQEAFGDSPNVLILRQKNQGKAHALNQGYRLAKSEVIVAIDADTIILPDAIGRLARHFEDPSIGAVAGNTKVGNRVNILTRLQAVEYITSQNLDRRAFEHFNAILVVPGAIGAWRKSVVDAVGGYSSDTLAEDADLTVAIIRAGYRVTYEEGAIAMTEAPETLRQLFRQRLRWSLGIMQTGWKHKRAIREKKGIGLVAIPNILLFGVILSLFAPIADIVFISALVRLVRDFIHHPTMIPGLSSPAVFIAYSVYLLSDVFLSALALMLEPKEDKRLLLLVPLQRFYYRQLLYIATLQSVGRAVTGRLTGWQKLTRTADVSNPAKKP